MPNSQAVGEIERIKDLLLRVPDSGRVELIGVLVRKLEEIRSNRAILSEVDLWNSIYELLYEGLAVEELWDYLREVSLCADVSLQATLSASVFELIAEASFGSPLKCRLFSFLEDRRLWWVFSQAYLRTSSKFYEDFSSQLANEGSAC